MDDPADPPHMLARKNADAFLASTGVVHGVDLSCPLIDFVAALRAFETANDLPGPPKYKLYLLTRSFRKHGLWCLCSGPGVVLGVCISPPAAAAAAVTRHNSTDVFLGGPAVTRCVDGRLPLADFKTALMAFEVSRGLRCRRKFNDVYFVGPFWKHGLRVEGDDLLGVALV